MSDLRRDFEGRGKDCTAPIVAPAHEGEWGALPSEPCRYCHQIGGVFFMIDDGPEGRKGLQVTRCDKCGRSWEADSSSA